MSCHGNADDHCCYLDGQVCDYLEEGTVPGRRWACGLLVKYGTWEAMADSVEYGKVGAHWEAIGHGFNYCETFDPAFCCRPENRFGRANDKTPYPDWVPVELRWPHGDVG